MKNREINRERRGERGRGKREGGEGIKGGGKREERERGMREREKGKEKEGDRERRYHSS